MIMSNTKKILLWALAMVVLFAIGGYLLDKNGSDWFEKREMKQDDGVIKKAKLAVDSLSAAIEKLQLKNDTLQKKIDALAATNFRIGQHMTKMKSDLVVAKDSLKHIKWSSATKADSLENVVDKRLLDSCEQFSFNQGEQMEDLKTQLHHSEMKVIDLKNIHVNDMAEYDAKDDELQLVQHHLKQEKHSVLKQKLIVIGEAVVIGFLTFHILTK